MDSMDDALVLMSMAILLDVNDETKKFVKTKAVLIANDRLLSCFATYIESRKIEWNENVKIDALYADLREVFTSEKKEVSLLNYLNKWYDNRKDFAWYNSHLKDTDTYCGYWSFESAAIAKMLKLNEKELETNVYYPMI